MYITPEWYYDDIFCDLTTKYNIKPYMIAYLSLPNETLLGQLKLFLDKREVTFTHPQEINAIALENAKLLPNRDIALQYMPKNAVCTEIGVAYGDFSQNILDVMKPSKFYAIDLFSEEHPYLWGRDDFVRAGMSHKEWYEAKFDEEIKAGILETRQGVSWDEIAKFPDDFFDFAYLDASHTYDSVKRDLSVLPQKVKNGGFIQFNDFTPGDVINGYIYGVIQAVTHFINSGNHKVLYFCIQPRGYHDILVQIFK